MTLPRTGRRARPLAMIAASTLVLTTACTPEPPAHETADAIYRNGHVYTADSAHSVAQAVAVRGDRIVFVGSDAEVAPWQGPQTRVVDLEGRMMLPGLVDAHVHSLGVVQPDVCDLKSEPKTLAELVPFLQECLQRYAVPKGEWLMVSQWSFSMGNTPDEMYRTLREALDAASSEHPILLRGNDGHHGAANSLALASARRPGGETIGLSAATLAGPLAEFRELVSVDERGEPSGGVTDAGMALLPAPGFFALGDPARTMPAVAQVFRESGITLIQDAAADPAFVELFLGLESSEAMTFRMRAALIKGFDDPTQRASPENLEATVQEFSAIRARLEQDSKLIRADAIKLFVDGVLEGNPLTQPPTLPNSAAIDPYLQPIYEPDGSGGVRVAGYVDPQSEACRAAADADTPAEAEAFTKKNGFHPAQCQQSSGVLANDEAFMHQYVQAMAKAGFRIHAHAIGDRAVRVAVDLLDDARAANPGAVHSIAHAQLVRAEDRARIGKGGYGVVFTHAWSLPNPPYDYTVVPFVQKVENNDLYAPGAYMDNVYPVASIAAAGGVVASGSDAPVETRDPRPFVNLEESITRADPWRKLDTVMNPAERLDVHQAIAAYTINGAHILGMADEVGSIEPGKKADLIVLDQDLLDLVAKGEAWKISDTKVLRTIFDGREVYTRP